CRGCHGAPVRPPGRRAEPAARFAHDSALSASAFPSTQHFESEVVAMVGSVVAPHSPAYGVFTTGGTESIMVAMKGYRDAGRGRRLVMPVTAHPGFWKAAARSEEHTSELQSRFDLVCRLLLEKKK